MTHCAINTIPHNSMPSTALQYERIVSVLGPASIQTHCLRLSCRHLSRRHLLGTLLNPESLLTRDRRHRVGTESTEHRAPFGALAFAAETRTARRRLAEAVVAAAVVAAAVVAEAYSI